MKQLTDTPLWQQFYDHDIEARCRKCRGLGTKRHHAMCPRRGCKTVKASYVMYHDRDGFNVSEIKPDGRTERIA